MSPKEWLDHAIDELKLAQVSSPRLDAQLMLEAVLERDRSSVSVDIDTTLSPTQKAQLDAMLFRRSEREPLAYILGKREFYGLQFEVNKNVLVPRPETESLVETAVNLAPQDARVLEIGTGSGAISVALASVRPDLHITATDISESALDVARKNAKYHKVPIVFKQADLFNGVDGVFNIVLANLPYVPEPARRQPEITHEPEVALFGGEDGLDYYRRFFKDLAKHVGPGALVLIEFSPTQYAALRTEYESLTIEPITEYIYHVQL